MENNCSINYDAICNRILEIEKNNWRKIKKIDNNIFALVSDINVQSTPIEIIGSITIGTYDYIGVKSKGAFKLYFYDLEKGKEKAKCLIKINHKKSKDFYVYDIKTGERQKNFKIDPNSIGKIFKNFFN